jgi:hypothetical protein
MSLSANEIHLIAAMVAVRVRCQQLGSRPEFRHKSLHMRPKKSARNLSAVSFFVAGFASFASKCDVLGLARS